MSVYYPQVASSWMPRNECTAQEIWEAVNQAVKDKVLPPNTYIVEDHISGKIEMHLFENGEYEPSVIVIARRTIAKEPE